MLQLTSPQRREELLSGGWFLGDSLVHAVEQQATARPSSLAVGDQERTFTYAELVDGARRVAGWLEGLDLPRGTVVAMQAPSSALLPVVHLACDLLDLVILPISHSFREAETRAILERAQASVVFVPDSPKHRDVITRLEAELDHLRRTVPLDGPEAETLVRIAESGPRSDRDADAADPARPCLAMVSSGTTALARASLWSGDNLWYLLDTYRQYAHLVPEDHAVGLAPSNGGSTGYVFPVLAPLLFGASSTILQHWRVEDALDLFAAQRPTLTTAVPTQLVQLLQDEDALVASASTLRVVNNAGAPLAVDVATRMELALDCRIQTSYGASDGGVPCMTRDDDPDDKRRATVGRPLPGVEMRLVDDDGPVPAGSVGEVQWRTPSKSWGYLNDPERDTATFGDDGYYRSGDLGRLDEDGYLRIVGRTKDMVIRGGRNINPAELEELLLRLDTVADVAVVGVPDVVYGERIGACVVAAGGTEPTLEEVRRALTDLDVESYKLPEHLRVVRALPRNPAQKIVKTDLVHLFDEEPQPS